MAKAYVEFETPKDLAERALDALESAMSSGEVRKGTNEATKAIERGIAKLVVMAEDVDPEEILMHIPVLCKEKNIPFLYVPSKQELGAAIGIEVSSAAASIVKEGDAKKSVEDIVNKISSLKK